MGTALVLAAVGDPGGRSASRFSPADNDTVSATDATAAGWHRQSPRHRGERIMLPARTRHPARDSRRARNRTVVRQVVTGTLLLALMGTRPVSAVVVPPSGHIYQAQVLSGPTQSCVAAGPGGSFVGIGPGFTANAQALVLAKESGETRLVAFGFNSLGDCAYDAVRDVLYVTDNAAEVPGALTGDTVFAIPGASAASGLPAQGLELIAAGLVPTAASVAVAGDGDVLVSDALGGGAGVVHRIDVGSAPALSTFATGFDFTAGLAVDGASGDVFVAETRGTTFDARIHRFDAAGAGETVFAGPSFAFGSFDLAFGADGRLLATGLFGGDVAVFDAAGTPSPFVSGLTFASGITVHPFTGRVEILSSFSGTAEDRSLHRFVPVGRLVAGGTRGAAECVHEFYGLPSGNRPRLSTCTDGAPCDADGAVNDRCLVAAGFCLNVADPALAECAATSPVTAAQVSSTPFAAAIADAGALLAASLPAGTSTCVFSDGIVVPVRHTRLGKTAGAAVLRVEVETAAGDRDVDRVRVRCEPAS